MTEYLDPLKKLHTVLIDSRNGYQEALSDADGNDIAPFFREMIDLRETHQAEIDDLLRKTGETPDESGSFMSVVNRTIFKIWALVNASDSSLLPGMIDGEERLIRSYEKVLRSAPPPAVASILNGQVISVREQIAKMQAMNVSTRA